MKPNFSAWKLIGALSLFVFATLLLVSAANSQQPTPPAVPPTPVPIVVDEQFAHDYEQFQALAKELQEMQQEMSAIQGRSQAHLEKLKGWMTDHHVPPNWNYEAAAHRFTPPAPPAQAPPPQKQPGQ